MKSIRDKTLEQLEKQVWKDPGDTTNLVTTIHRLRKKAIKDFSIEDLRVTIGQNCGLAFLVPFAIEKLRENILTEGNYYPGDLLNNVLTADREFWINNKEDWETVMSLYQQHKEIFESDTIYRQIRKSFDQFMTIHEQH